ncbi:MAG: SOS response-associated peptidase family protein, partial [Rudaea sp.]
SAQIKADYASYLHAVGREKALNIGDFLALYWERSRDSRIKIPKAIDAWFAKQTTDDEAKVAKLISDFNTEQITQLEQELFKQKKRLADAQRILQTKTTKKALEEQRIATNKIEWAMGKLNDIRRKQIKDKDARIFPGWYAPVIVVENGKRVIKPMRYQCRPQGKPVFYDRKFPGTYNARRDNLEGFWKNQFGHSHGLMIVNAFYENVSRHKAEGRELAPGEKEENVILEFRPTPPQDMLVACLWSHWQHGDDQLDSFAAITDEPPAEIAAAGHDRCIIPIKPEHIDAWLNPDPNNLDALYAILDDRARPYYQHRMAA